MTVRFSSTSDQELFATAVRELLDKQCAPEALRAAWDSESGRVPGLWSRLAELGVPALAVPEEHEGMGGGDLDLVPIAVEAGRAALPEPLVETLAAARTLAELGGDLAAEWLPQVATGEATIGVQVGPGRFVSGAGWADLYLLQRPDGVVALPSTAADASSEQSVDRGIRLARVATDQQPLPGSDAAALFDRVALLAAAQLVGLTDAMLAMAVRYATERTQFGKPIGSFQAVKHQLADVYIGLEFARPVLARAAWSVDRGLPTRARDVSAAMALAGDAALRAARSALQVHGAIGYTYEHDLHMWLKRTWSLTSLWGDPAWHRARVAEAVLDRGEERVP